MYRSTLTISILFAASTCLHAADEKPRAKGNPQPAKQVSRQEADESAIRQAIESYVATFNRGDAKGLAALWSTDGVYINPVSGEQAVGREEIAKQFGAIFEASKGVKLEAKTDAVSFVSPNVAVEQGTATIVRQDQEPEISSYNAVYVKRDGQWLLDRVTESDVPVVVSNYDHLKDLEWMIGSWVDDDGQSRIQTDCQWTKNRNFITRSFAVSIEDRIEMSGMQIVGWDPDQKRIRSWIFDSDGGFGEGVWTRKDNRWSIQSTATTPDGRKTSSVNILKYVDNDTFTWQSLDRVVDGELLPNVDEVVVVRQSDDN